MRSLPLRGSSPAGCAEWHVDAVNFVQAIIGCVYGFVDVDRIAASASVLRKPQTLSEDAFIRGVVLQCTRRKQSVPSPTDAVRLIAVVEDISRVSASTLPHVIADLRTLLGLDGSDLSARVSCLVDRSHLAERIRAIVDGRYASKLTVAAVAKELDVEPAYAESEIERRFGMGFQPLLTRRRVIEGLALVRDGMKVESAAAAVGYNGKAHFYKAVYEWTGTTPARAAKRERERERERRLDEQ